MPVNVVASNWFDPDAVEENELHSLVGALLVSILPSDMEATDLFTLLSCDFE